MALGAKNTTVYEGDEVWWYARKNTRFGGVVEDLADGRVKVAVEWWVDTREPTDLKVFGPGLDSGVWRNWVHLDRLHGPASRNAS